MTSNKCKFFFSTFIIYILFLPAGGPLGVLIGSARHNYKLQMAAEEILRENVEDKINKEIAAKKLIPNARIGDITSQFESEKEGMNRILDEEKLKKCNREKPSANDGRSPEITMKRSPKETPNKYER